ncbi:MAG: sodium:solute symporter family protein [Bacteriovoracaceae bacterium]|nr:sodium:solute symporter family protein [Bacteriovoracaceae bacterium]
MPFFENSPDLLSILTWLDWLVFFSILVITIAFVFYGGLHLKKETKQFDLIDHLIMGRRLTTPFFIATLVATWYGGIFGVTQIAFNKGIYNFITQGVFWYIAYFIFALFLVDKITSYKAVTLPDLIEKMFGPKSGKVAAIFNFFNVLPIAYVISLGLFIKSFSGFGLNTSMILGLICVLSYSVWGGLRSIVLSDMIQFFVMCTGVFLVIGFSVSTFGGISFLKNSLPPHYFSLTSDETLLQTLIWGFIALSTLVDPNFYQRCFAAKDTITAKKGILFSTAIWILFDLSTTFGAMYAKAVMPQANAGEAYLYYSTQLLPNGLRGFFLAGILATILSTLDSYLFLAGTTLTYDLSNERNRENPIFHYIGVIFVGVLSLSFANFFEGNIKLVWKTLGSYSAGCLLFPVLIGHFSKRKFSDESFMASCLFAAFTMTLWQVLAPTEWIKELDSLYIGVLTSSFVLIGLNKLSRQKSSP